jgi:hypothetical protein
VGASSHSGVLKLVGWELGPAQLKPAATALAAFEPRQRKNSPHFYRTKFREVRCVLPAARGRQQGPMAATAAVNRHLLYLVEESVHHYDS